MFRLWFKTFFGEPHFEQHGSSHAPDLHAGHLAAVHASKTSTLVLEAEPEPVHAHGVHESPWIMTVPLIILAILSVIGGWVGIPAALGGHNEFEHFLSPVFASATAPAIEATTQAASHALELTLAAISLLTAALGFFIAYLFYYRKPGTAAALAKKFAPIYSLVNHKYWVDEIYGRFLITPLLVFSRLILGGLVDGGIIQGTGSSLAASTRGGSWLVRRIQSGNIRSYAGWLAIGAAAVIAIVLFGHHALPH
jgi:NADH-quinone oxidoreductase subunit L